MGTGGRMWMLWRLRRGEAIALVFSILATTWTLYDVQLSPFSLRTRTMAMATASTKLVVDTPGSTMLDLRAATNNFLSLRDRAILLGNLIASSSVRNDIGRRVGISGGLLEVAAPRTPEQPRTVVGNVADKKTTDILRSNDQYRLSIQASPTVPMLDIYAEAPDAKTSSALANAADDSVHQYLDDLARKDGTPPRDQIRLRQLGRADGAVINGGVSPRAGLLAFILTFAAGCGTVVFFHRVRRDWHVAAMTDRV
jgi:hypothetical protein